MPRNPSPFLGYGNKNNTKTKVVITVVGIIVVDIRRLTVVGVVVITAAAINAVRVPRSEYLKVNKRTNFSGNAIFYGCGRLRYARA